MEQTESVATDVKKEQHLQVIYSFLEYLQQVKADAKLDEDALESVDVASQCLSNAFKVSLDNEDQKKKYSLAPHTLPSVLGVGINGREKLEQAVEQLHKKGQATDNATDIEGKFYQYLQAIRKRGLFNDVTPGTQEYEKRYTRARQKFLEKYQPSKSKEEESPKASPPVQPKVVSEENIQAAEKYKNQGNEMLSSQQYTKAIEFYTKAIELNPGNAIYYANRAAALSHMGSHEQAIKDCKISISLNPNYSKAYGRLGLAYFSLGQYAEAVEQYKKGLELEPNNPSLKDSLAAAQKKLQAQAPKPQPQPGTAPVVPPGGVPNPSELFSNPDLLNSMSGMFGGGNNLSSILSNPLFQSMAQQIMSNPQMMNMATNLMQDPEAMGNMMNSLGGMMRQGGDQQPEEKKE